MGTRTHSHKNSHGEPGPSRSDHRQSSPASKDQGRKQQRIHRSRHHSSSSRHPHHSSSSASHFQTKPSRPAQSRNPSTASPVPLLPHPPHVPPIPLVPEPSSSFNSLLPPSLSALPLPSISTTTLVDATASPTFTPLSSSGSFATTFVPLTTSIPSGSMISVTGNPVPGPPTDLAKISGSPSSTNLGIVLGIVIGGLALMGLAAVFWFRYRERQLRRMEMKLNQQGYLSEGRWGGDSENGKVETVRSGGAVNATGVNGASDLGSTGTGIARLTTEPSPPMTSYRHEAFMALVKEAALGFYAPSVDQPLAATGSLSAENPAVSAGTAVDSRHPPLTSGDRGSKVEGEKSVHRQEESSPGPSDDGIQYLDVGSPRPPPTQ